MSSRLQGRNLAIAPRLILIYENDLKIVIVVGITLAGDILIVFELIYIHKDQAVMITFGLISLGNASLILSLFHHSATFLSIGINSLVFFLYFKGIVQKYLHHHQKAHH